MDQKLLLALLGAAVLHFAVAIGFLFGKNSADHRLDQTITSLQEQWKEADLQKRNQEEEELQSKYGTNRLDRIAFDPRMDIQLVVQKMFEAVLPPEYSIEVSVNRFTEFKVFANVYNMPPTDVLAGYLKEVFSRIDPHYVDQVIFTDEDHFWIIDNGQLLRVGDWENAGLSQIQRSCFPS